MVLSDIPGDGMFLVGICIPPCWTPWIFLANGTWSTWSCYRDSCTALPVLSQTASVIVISPCSCWCGLSPQEQSEEVWNPSQPCLGWQVASGESMEGDLSCHHRLRIWDNFPLHFHKADGTKIYAIKGITVSCCYCYLLPWIRSEWAKYACFLCSFLQVFSNKFLNYFPNMAEFDFLKVNSTPLLVFHYQV